MSQSNLEKHLQSLTPVAPGPQVRAEIVAAAQAAAPAAGVDVAAKEVSGLKAVTPPRAKVLPLRRVFSIAALFLCVAAVGLTAWYAQPRGPATGGIVHRDQPTPPSGTNSTTLASAKELPTATTILNTVPPRIAPIDPRYEVAKSPAFCRMVAVKGLVTGREAQAGAGRWHVLEAEDTLKAGGTVRVSGDGLSYAVIALQDGSEVLVGSGSELTLTTARDLKLNGGRALVRVSPGADFQLMTSANETVAVSGGGAGAKPGASLAAFQVTDRVFQMGADDTYVPRWKRGETVSQMQGETAGDTTLPKAANLAVLHGAVALSAQGGQRKKIDAGQRVDLYSSDWNINHDLSRVATDCLWLQACSVAADRGVGSLAITAGDAAALSPIEIGRVEIRVEVRDQIAMTVIDEYFVNKNDRQLEGKFYFPLPADASISGFAMWIDDRKVQGEIVERERAREIYEQILRENRDPGLLEWAGGNEFQARIFPIPPKGEKHIRISYTQVLPYRAGRVHYSYPLMSEMLRKNPLASLQVNVNIHEDALTADLRSESHAAAAGQDSLEFTARNYSPAQDFSASWIPNGQMPELKVLPHVRADEGGFYMAMVTPYTDAEGKPIQPTVDSSPAPRRWLFVVDASGSVTAETWALTRATLDSVFATAGGEDTFNVIVFDLEPRLLFPDFQPASGVNFDNVSRQLSKIDPFGASNMEKAFTLAAEQAAKPAPDEMATTVVYLGDGVASAGEQRTAKLIETIGQKFSAVKNCSGYAIGIGGSCEGGFLDGVARRLNGLGLRVDGLNNIAATVGQLSDSAGGGLLTGLTVTVDGVKVADQYPQVLPNLRLGDQLILAGRYSGAGQSTVTVAGQLNGKAWSKTFKTQFPEGEIAGTNPFVPRLWAKRHIAHLLNQIDLDIGDAGEMKAAIIDASKKYTLITPFTSFLVLESEEDYRRFNVEHNFNMEDFAGKKEGKGDEAAEEGLLKNADLAMDMPASPPAPEMAAAPKTAAPPMADGKEGEKKALEEVSRQGGQNKPGEPSLAKDKALRVLEANSDDGEMDAENLLRESESQSLADRKPQRLESRKLKQGNSKELDSLEEYDPGFDEQDRDRLGNKRNGVEKYDSISGKSELAKGMAGEGGGGSYGSRSGRRRAVMRGGGTRASEESIFPEMRTREQVVNALTVEGVGANWLQSTPAAAPQTLGEYRLISTQLPQAVDPQAQPTLKQLVGRLVELSFKLAPVDTATQKPVAATDRIAIRADAVEHSWLGGAEAKLQSDGRYTLLMRGDDLPIKRQAQPGDRHLVLQQGPAFLAYSYDEIAAAFDVTWAGEKNGIATLVFVERAQGGKDRLRVQIDTAKGTVLRIDRYTGDTLNGSSEFSGYREVAPGVQAPTLRTDRDASGKVSGTVAFVELTAKAP